MKTRVFLKLEFFFLSVLVELAFELESELGDTGAGSGLKNSTCFVWPI